ncbi:MULTISPECIES: zinc-binding dehydrogenase [unclassified Saccharopolyspora]|uniref:zinc-binding dehydrogenase n=1 Tax=unclassified Saccharopolyspora TaxID=2646250 RepID=UPI001CD47016|nr:MULTISPECIES: zinc-binding dehydrogenase [unclassified Saccharopolyspora]MCA1187885.1 zinc-binding dehydrogenase [Saccharopolyspora sp. 6T]MCA1278629.1 zinc-binding dehydrogenase [Saccharopolyspora sp. 7B]
MRVIGATLPMNALTARQALDLLDSAPGEAIAVTGAAGAFGGCVVQLAKADGLRVVADAADRDRELVRSLGADVVVARGDDVAERIREAAPAGSRPRGSSPPERSAASPTGRWRGASTRRSGKSWTGRGPRWTKGC